MNGTTTLKALKDAAHSCMELDGGTQFKIFDRLTKAFWVQTDSDLEEDALEDLLKVIVRELEIALAENKPDRVRTRLSNKDLQSRLRTKTLLSIKEKLVIVANLAGDLAYNYDKVIDTDELYGKVTSDRIWIYVDGLAQKRIYNGVNCRLSVAKNIKFDLSEEEKIINKDIRLFKRIERNKKCQT